MIKQQHKQVFWDVVEECLRAFHGFAPDAAHARVKSFRVTLDKAPRGVSRNSIYHAEPFDVACDLADNLLDLGQHRQQYESILKLHGSDFQGGPP